MFEGSKVVKNRSEGSYRPAVPSDLFKYGEQLGKAFDGKFGIA